MCWLVITNILVRCTESVNMVFHQWTDTILSFEISS